MTQIIAHRGASCAAPENTLAAFEQAISARADGVELDVHLTADGSVVVIHDDAVDRTTNGSGAVHEMTLEQVQGLDASMGQAGFAGIKIPTLAEVYALLQKTNLTVNVELKENAYHNGFAVIPKVLELEEQYGMSGKVYYSSFNHYVLRELKHRSGQIQTGILYGEPLVDVWDYAEAVPADAVHPNYQVLQDANVVRQCHALGIAVRPWTVNQEHDLQEMFVQKVDAVITNDPALARAIR
ncbi:MULTISPECIES: glycerophosphodiester phosphodiesterase [Caproicibacterium]|uniref:Glycerophosphodiester phosphodiesterase n=1 Tax=Caproicibacterium argilliputei TaxID=3030016 RepID=A0AA97D7L0_9FIRM|nr:glycerophosphodiester phosphodiesterase [Caproicibacterium argilliputei]WOC31149.1 glycerophosphodiester phosphodiesterase [Caproicibacterium argilliputei]